ncbi:hypothetical protein CDD82_25 [Ophiocordyceps australis]|uniref:Uncharacterized protein n=1 Tax=Ophiocordyceps australis TaxID=1399860 RepID=A0A2C5ZWJ3_9HYPO|nr:hypothetical protein CDD82_25 [Ophiocordyceps australis]
MADCCPSCCQAPDLGVHDYCLPCQSNPDCPNSYRRSSAYEPDPLPPTRTLSWRDHTSQQNSPRKPEKKLNEKKDAHPKGEKTKEKAPGANEADIKEKQK